MISNAIRWMGRNLGTLLLAFALALTVWVSSTIAADPNEECVAPKLIPLEIIGEDPDFMLMNEIPTQIRIDLFAPRSVCNQLREEGLDTAKIDLTGLGSGTHNVVVTLPEIPLRPHRIEGHSPREVTVTLERLITETYKITLVVTGEPALGFQASTPILDTDEVSIAGPESLVTQVSEVRASLDISNARETFNRTLNVQVLDDQGAVVSGVTLVPNRISVTQQVLQLGRYRELVVQVKTTGQWATGYRLTSITVSPPTVTIFSVDPQQVTELPGFVETLPIDLTDASDDVVSSVALNLPEGITLVGRETVLVQVSIAAIENNLIMSLPVEVIGLDPEYQVQLSPETVDVILFGPLPVLEDLVPENLRVVVDLTELGEGTWSVLPLVDILPDRVQEEGINPPTIEAIISLIPTPTPTPTPEVTPTPTDMP